MFAAHAGIRYTTRLALHNLRVRWLAVGQTLPAGSRVAGAFVNGRRVRHFSARLTNRGLEVTVRGHGTGPFTVTVISG